MGGQGNGASPGDRISASRALLWCHSAYLDGLFAEVDDRWGSFDAFVEDGLGLGDDCLRAFRSALLD